MKIVKIFSAMIILMTLVISTSCNDLFVLPAKIRRFHQEKDFSGTVKEFRVVAKISMGDFYLDRSPREKLYSLDMQWDEANMRKKVDFSDGSSARLKVNLSGRTSAVNSVRTSLSLSDRIPVDLSLESGVGENRLNLTGLQIRELTLKEGVSEMNLYIDEPQVALCKEFTAKSGVGEMKIRGILNLAPKEFVFKGGIGEAVLDFTGNPLRDVDATVKVGIGHVELVLPSEDIGIKLSIKEGLHGGISLPASFFEVDGKNMYKSINWSEAERKLYLNVVAGIGNIEIRLSD